MLPFPLVLFLLYSILGCVTVAVFWPALEVEVEMAIDQSTRDLVEEDDIPNAQNAQRVFLTLAFVIFWPILVFEISRR